MSKVFKTRSDRASHYAITDHKFLPRMKPKISHISLGFCIVAFSIQFYRVGVLNDLGFNISAPPTPPLL